MSDLVAYFIKRHDTILKMTGQHLRIVCVALLISIVLGIIIGILITKNKMLANLVLNIDSILMTIPSLALFSLLIPFLGIGTVPATVGLVAYTQLPIVRNVYTGLTNINPSIVDSAKGIGLSPARIMLKVKIPLALPVFFAGVRTAVVLGMGIAAIAAYVGAGGLGTLIFNGVNRANNNMVLSGAIVISILTIIVDQILYRLQKYFERKIGIE